MHTRLAITTLFLGALLLCGPLRAQEHYAFGFSPNSGDAWVDAQLGDFNVYAAGNLDGFVDEVVVSYGAPRVLVREYVVDRRWPPGDVYYACALAHYSHRPCRAVLDIWEHEHGKGWGVIAKRLGIKPGSAEFHAMKADLGKSKGRSKAKDHGPGNSKDKGKGRDKNHGPPGR
jgi:hypothetical protein